jgi:hypothetical protein
MSMGVLQYAHTNGQNIHYADTIYLYVPFFHPCLHEDFMEQHGCIFTNKLKTMLFHDQIQGTFLLQLFQTFVEHFQFFFCIRDFF